VTVALRERAAAALELRARRAAAPLAYTSLWDRPAPRTSQRRALLAITTPGLQVLDVGGGNRTGKSFLLAQWLVACAAGLDATISTPRGPVAWVRRWLSRNGLPEGVLPGGERARPPATVWVASATNSASVDQIRPHIKALCPAGTVYTGWDSRSSQGVARLPNGGQIVTKTYKEYAADPQTWEGAAVRAIGCDEEPPAGAVRAGLSRLVDLEGRLMVALTALSGTSSSYYREIEEPAPNWYRKVHLYGEDNPHVSQKARRRMVAAMPAWQQAARDKGERVDPAGRIWPWNPAVHEIEPFPVPPEWHRWVGVDWGGRAPHVLWAAEDPAGDGRLILYRELAPRRDVNEPAVSGPALVSEAQQIEADDLDADRAAWQAAHPDAEGRPDGVIWRTADSEAPGDILEAQRMGWAITAAKKGKGSVSEGLRDVEAMLATEHPITGDPQAPRIVAMRGRCPVTVAEIRGLKWADTRAGVDPRPDPACPDHGPDALRYLVKRRRALGFR